MNRSTRAFDRLTDFTFSSFKYFFTFVHLTILKSWNRKLKYL